MLNTNEEIIKNTKHPLLTVSIISIESSFNKKAVNKKSGATGLGQIHPIHKNELKEAGIINKFSDLKNRKNSKKIDVL